MFFKMSQKPQNINKYLAHGEVGGGEGPGWEEGQGDKAPPVNERRHLVLNRSMRPINFTSVDFCLLLIFILCHIIEIAHHLHAIHLFISWIPSGSLTQSKLNMATMKVFCFKV